MITVILTSNGKKASAAVDGAIGKSFSEPLLDNRGVWNIGHAARSIDNQGLISAGDS